MWGRYPNNQPKKVWAKTPEKIQRIRSNFDLVLRSTIIKLHRAQAKNPFANEKPIPRFGIAIIIGKKYQIAKRFLLSFTFAHTSNSNDNGINTARFPNICSS